MFNNSITHSALLISTALLLFTSNAPAQTYSSHTGDESKCPYLHPQQVAKQVDTTSILIDDFESAEFTYKKWSNSMESGTMKSSIDLSDTMHSGKKSARISFSGVKQPDGWTNLHCNAEIPANKTKITFWAKAPRACSVTVTLYQGVLHNELEIFGKSIVIDTTWKKYELAISDFTELVFSHFIQDGGKASEKLTRSKVTGIGFADKGVPATFFIDDLKLE